MLNHRLAIACGFSLLLLSGCRGCGNPGAGDADASVDPSQVGSTDASTAALRDGGTSDASSRDASSGDGNAQAVLQTTPPHVVTGAGRVSGGTLQMDVEVGVTIPPAPASGGATTVRGATPTTP